MRHYHHHALLVGGSVAALAVALNAGVAWTFWRVGETAAATVPAGSAVELAVSATTTGSALDRGDAAALAVTVENPNPFPIEINTVVPRDGEVVADAEHRDAGCRVTGVSLARQAGAVFWRIDKRSTATFILPRSVEMGNRSGSACQGATFTIPLRVSGSSAS